MSLEINFTEVWLKKLKAPKNQRAEYKDKGCKGLVLRVTSNGIKTFSYPFRFKKKTGRITLGRYPDYGLRSARLKTTELRVQIAKGDNPLYRDAKSKKLEELTVEKMAREFIELYSKPKNKSWKQSESNLRLYLLPSLGKKYIHEITRQDIHNILDRLTAENKFTACNRALAHIKKFFGWLAEREYLEHSPVDRIKLRHRESPRERVLSNEEIRAIWKALESMSLPYRHWIKLLFLCAQREEETACIRKEQIENDIWTLGSKDTKNKAISNVPLSNQADQIIQEIMSRSQQYLLSTGRIGDKPINGFSKAKVKVDSLSGVSNWRI
tara:strand:+ start:197 stop:1171 length:975 start_codon:yes stop_codon:yes gene_type:complete